MSVPGLIFIGFGVGIDFMTISYTLLGVQLTLWPLWVQFVLLGIKLPALIVGLFE